MSADDDRELHDDIDLIEWVAMTFVELRTMRHRLDEIYVELVEAVVREKVDGMRIKFKGRSVSSDGEERM